MHFNPFEAVSTNHAETTTLNLHPVVQAFAMNVLSSPCHLVVFILEVHP